jgi:tetratricopeptide (TPR) repeat protein
MSGRRKLGKTGWICILLVVAVWAVYLPVVGFDFTNYDDPDYVTKNPPVRAGLTGPSIAWAFTHSHSANWHPLTWLSHMLDCQVFGMHAGGHHLTNLLLHTANTLLLFMLLRTVTGELWRSGLVAAVFGLHPMHVESVAWVAERKDVLSTCFGLLTLWAYATYESKVSGLKSKVGEREESKVQSPKSKVGDWRDSKLQTPTSKVGWWYGLALLFFALGLMSKPMLVTLPFLMLLLDYWPLQRFSGTAKDWLRLAEEKVPFFALAAASCAVTVLVQRAQSALAPLAQTPLGSRLANAAVCYVLYIWKLIWPARLAVLYPEVDHWPIYIVALALIFLVAVTGLVLWQRKERPWLLMGWAWFGGMLVPVIGLVKVGSHLITDRYTYLPSVGLFIMAVWGFGELLRSPAMERPRRALAGAVILGCMLLAQAQVMRWRNTETLFRHTLAVTTSNYVAYTSLAFDLAEKKERVEAEKCLRASLAINPTFEPAWTKLASLLVDQGKFDEAVEYCQKALRADPRSAGAHSTWGLALIRQGQTNAALAHYEQALSFKPDFADAHYNIGNALAGQGQTEAAVKHYEAAIHFDPYSANYHNNLAYMLLRERKLDRAFAEFRAALALDPDSWHARYGLGDTLVRLGKFAAGASELSRVLEVQPDLPAARLQLGVALEAQGHVTEAIETFSEAVQRKPDFALAHYHLGLLLSQQGKTMEAIAHYREAVQVLPNFADALNRLAWLLSVSPEAAIRNGAQAVEFAERACKASNYGQPAMVLTLAAAYAEAGRFEDAVRTAEKVCTGSPGVDAEFGRTCREMLERFRAGKPYQEAVLQR